MTGSKTVTTKERLMIGYCNQFERTGYSRCGAEMANIISKYWAFLHEQGLTDELWGVRLVFESLVSGDEKYESYRIE